MQPITLQPVYVLFLETCLETESINSDNQDLEGPAIEVEVCRQWELQENVHTGPAQNDNWCIQIAGRAVIDYDRCAQSCGSQRARVDAEAKVGAKANSDVRQNDWTWLTSRSIQSAIGIKASDPRRDGRGDLQAPPTGDKFTRGATGSLIDVHTVGPRAPRCSSSSAWVACGGPFWWIS